MDRLSHLHTLPLAIDFISAATLGAWWAGIVPSVATTLTALWVAYRLIKEIYYDLRKRKKK